MNLKTPYEDGRAAGRDGKSRDQNPYDRHARGGRTGMRRRAWNRGFTAAMKEKDAALEKQKA